MLGCAAYLEGKEREKGPEQLEGGVVWYGGDVPAGQNRRGSLQETKGDVLTHDTPVTSPVVRSHSSIRKALQLQARKRTVSSHAGGRWMMLSAVVVRPV